MYELSDLQRNMEDFTVTKNLITEQRNWEQLEGLNVPSRDTALEIHSEVMQMNREAYSTLEQISDEEKLLEEQMVQ